MPARRLYRQGSVRGAVGPASLAKLDVGTSFASCPTGSSRPVKRCPILSCLGPWPRHTRMPFPILAASHVKCHLPTHLHTPRKRRVELPNKQCHTPAPLGCGHGKVYVFGSDGFATAARIPVAVPLAMRCSSGSILYISTLIIAKTLMPTLSRGTATLETVHIQLILGNVIGHRFL